MSQPESDHEILDFETPAHQLIKRGGWVEKDGDDYLLMDPVSGEPLDPDVPPAFLLENSSLLDGYEHTGALHRLTPLDILLSTGESQASNLGTEFEANVGEPQTTILGHTATGVLRTNTRDRSLRTENENEYTKRIANAGLDIWAGSFFVGLEVDAVGLPATRTERAIQKMADMAQVNRLEADDRGAGQWVLDAISRNARQWYEALRVATRMTHTVNMLADNGGILLERAVLVVPYHNIDIGRKLGVLGMKNIQEEELVPDSFKVDTDAKDVDLFIRSGRIMGSSLGK